MHGREIRQRRALLEASENRALDMFAGWRHGHAMRLIDNNDFVVAENDKRLLNRLRFKWHMLPVINHDPVPIRRVLAQRRAIAESDETLRNSLTPGVRMNLWESSKQVLEDCRRRIVHL